MKRFLVLVCIVATTLAPLWAQALKRDKSDACRTRLIEEWKQDIRQRYGSEWRERALLYGDLCMKIHTTTYGNKPEGGRSLWISLHGGGAVPTALNNQQWDNQKRLYKPSEGIYLAPRAAYDDWDMHCKPKTDSLYQKLIQAAIAIEDVNPNRVFLLGYSAGGDGVWRLAPRMADTWAAASMMAGHPGDVSLVNLRNLPFMIWCGALDAAYDRNKLDEERGKMLDELQRQDPEGYVHETHIMAGMGHWMNRADTAAIDWMAQHTRNPYPKRIVWRQEEVLRPAFYWLEVSKSEMKRWRNIHAEIKGQTITIEECDYETLTLWLNDELLNLDQKIQVVYNGKVLFNGRVKRTEANLRESLWRRGDPAYAFPAKITLNMRAQK